MQLELQRLFVLFFIQNTSYLQKHYSACLNFCFFFFVFYLILVCIFKEAWNSFYTQILLLGNFYWTKIILATLIFLKVQFLLVFGDVSFAAKN